MKAKKKETMEKKKGKRNKKKQERMSVYIAAAKTHDLQQPQHNHELRGGGRWNKTSETKVRGSDPPPPPPHADM